MRPGLPLASALAAALFACAESVSTDDGGAPPTSSAGTGAHAGAGDASAGDAGGPALGPICDLGDRIRFGFTSGGGFVAPTYGFTNPYGDMFLFVDGGCRYYASIGYMQGFTTGMLSSEQVELLADAIGWNRIGEWSGYRDQVCPDAGARTLMVPGAAATCICQCADMGPEGLDDAMQMAVAWTRLLFDSGEPSDGPISALADTQIRPSGHELPWPLDRSVSSIPNLVQDAVGGSAAFASFDAPSDLAALRALRRAALLGDQYASFVPVLDGDTAYLLFARDDLPPEVDVAIRELRGSQD